MNMRCSHCHKKNNQLAKNTTAAKDQEKKHKSLEELQAEREELYENTITENENLKKKLQTLEKQSEMLVKSLAEHNRLIRALQQDYDIERHDITKLWIEITGQEEF